MARREVSPGIGSGANSDRMPARVDPEHLHRTFPHHWATWLKERGFTNKTIVAAFAVDDRTARNWLAGISAPRAHQLAALETARPGAILEIIAVGTRAA